VNQDPRTPIEPSIDHRGIGGLSRRAAVAGGLGALAALAATPATAAFASTSIRRIPRLGSPFIDMTQAPYRVVMDGTTDNTAAIQAAVADNPGGAALYFPPGVCIAKEIPVNSQFTFVGDAAGATTLQSLDGDLMILDPAHASGIHYCTFSHLTLAATGGHVFSVGTGGMSRSVWEYCIMRQNSPDYSVFYQSGTKALFIDNTIIGCDIYRPTDATVPAMYFQSHAAGFNSNRILYSRLNGANALQPFIHCEAAVCHDNVFSGLTFELCAGGAINALSARGLTVSDCGVWDSRIPYVTDLFRVGKASYGLMSNGITFINSGRRGSRDVPLPDGIYDINCQPGETESCVIIGCDGEWHPGAVRAPRSSVIIGTGDSPAALRAGSFGVGNSAAASSLGSVVRKVEIFDEAGTSIGFLPVYDSIS
jgi:hypothetical protein